MKSIYSKLVIGFLLTSLLSFSICCFFTIRSYNRDSDQLALEELEHSSEHIADMIQLIDVKNQDKILSDYSETSEMSFTVTCEGQTKSYGHVNKKLILTEDELKTLATSKEKTLRSEGIVSQYAKAFKIDNQICDYSSEGFFFYKRYLYEVLYKCGNHLYDDRKYCLPDCCRYYCETNLASHKGH